MLANGKDSDWFSSLEGKSPLLSRSDWEFIANIRHRIIQEAKSHPKPSFTSDEQKHLRYKLSVMKKNFEKVVEYLKENLDSKEYFLRTYPAWRTVRSKTIIQLKDIAKTVNKDKQECKAAGIAGSTVSIVGALICLATGGAALRFLGATFMGLGTFTKSIIAPEMEIDSLQQNIKKAEKIIEEDREYSKELWDWLNDASGIQEALEIIRNIDVDKNLKKAADDLHACPKTKRNEYITMVIENLLKPFKINPEISKEIADIVGMLIAIHMLYDRFRSFFNLAFEAYKRKELLSFTFDTILSSLNISSVISASNKKLTAYQKSSVFLGMAMDTINIISASNDANEISQEAKKIIEAAEILEKEARNFKNLYNAVQIL